ncbi:MAG: SDR family NAD(P)-dependent oxidoreductase [Cyclobacteriaceae bacterium]
MEKEIQELISISRYFGSDKSMVIAGGGNTSVKNQEVTYVKASGFSLANIDENGFVALSRSYLASIDNKEYPKDSQKREEAVKIDLLRSRIDPDKNQRPSVEASLHNIIDFKYVVHLHPTFANGVLCAVDGQKHIEDMFSENALFVPYTDPGFILFKEVKLQLDAYKLKHGNQPAILFLENHGVFVGAETIDEIKKIYEQIRANIHNKTDGEPKIEDLPVADLAAKVMPGLRGILSRESLKTLRIRNNSLISDFIKDKASFEDISQPFNPDGIVYCKAQPVFIDEESDPKKIIAQAETKIEEYRKAHGFDPKVIIVKGLGIIASGDHSAAADIILDVFEDNIKIAWYANFFGGKQFLSEASIAFIDNWEVENFRRQVSKGNAGGRIENKIAIVTGGAQGFGLGIVEGLLKEGANVVIADMNEETGKEAVASFQHLTKKNQVIFQKVNITKSEEVKQLMQACIKYFGGLDMLVCNAGVLRAGSLEELEERDFDFVTEVNYKGYYLCVKYGVEPMKLQFATNKALYADVLQINSKSGLQGSNKNYAYAGSKFGTIGLTQSFALELVPFHIKVNSICPGNYFGGPLWSDPENGLFAQYLRAGKVPGAKSIDDVRRFYEDKVPMQRGCLPEDVVKAIIYAVEQNYETGQAIPVSGGQVMLS